MPVKGPDGRLSKASTFTVSQEDGAPDGMTIDRCARAAAPPVLKGAVK